MSFDPVFGVTIFENILDLVNYNASNNIDRDTLIEYCTYLGIPRPHRYILDKLKLFYSTHGYLPEDLHEVCKYILSICTCGEINHEDLYTASEVMAVIVKRENRIPNCRYVSLYLEYFKQEGRIPTPEELSSYINNVYQIENDPERYHQDDKLKVPTPNLENLKSVVCCKEDNCGLCMEEIKEGEECFKLSCGHIYHSIDENCVGNTVKKWLSENKSCPVCKQEVNITTTKE